MRSKIIPLVSVGLVLLVTLFLLVFVGALKIPAAAEPLAQPDPRIALIEAAFMNTRLEAPVVQRLHQRMLADYPRFIQDLTAVLKSTTDSYMYRLVDKVHALPKEYAPTDLVPLTRSEPFLINRNDLSLRLAAVESLRTMSRAAAAEGISLLVSSTYRSWAYQDGLYARNVARYGQAQTDRESARPGHSEHQLGLVVDFGSIDDSFAETKAGRWLSENAMRFGWTLSYPAGHEAVTGYRWESWHYRFVGVDMAALIYSWFEGIPQYALEFIQEWLVLTQEAALQER